MWRGSTSINSLFYTTKDFTGLLTNENVELIRKVIRERFGIDASFRTSHQVHGSTVLEVHRGAPTWLEAEASDALWTRSSNVALGTKVADCLPVTLVDPDHEILGSAHSGWRGGVLQITHRLLEAMAVSAFSAKTATAFLGPSIRACCFEVGPEVVKQFQESYGQVDEFVDKSRAKAHFDLPGLTRKLLLARGIPSESIVDSGLCTRCDGSIFHSYRRDSSRAGRNFAIVAQQ